MSSSSSFLAGPLERLIFRMAVFDGMRTGEILAIRIGNIAGKHGEGGGDRTRDVQLGKIQVDCK